MNSQAGTNKYDDLFELVWSDIRIHLEKHKHRLYEEIKNYPPPITACDQQFNYLLEEQSRISREMSRLDSASHESATHSDAIEIIDAFIRSSSYLDDEAKQRIRSRLKAGLLKSKT